MVDHPSQTLQAGIATFSKDQCRLVPDRPIVIGVSGGPDSLCLADILHRSNFRTIIAHFDHQLRPESHADASFVEAWSHGKHLPFFLGQEDVKALSLSKGLSIEEAARIARYHFLFSIARKTGAQAVAVGHNADDQVETILMHLLRGAGLAGLRGMLPYSFNEGWDPAIPLVRPLLSTWRSEIDAYCAGQGLNPVIDSTNQDLTYYRNRLRHQLVPYLESYNPKVRSVIWRSGLVLAGEAEVLDALLKDAWTACFREFTREYVCLYYQRLLNQPIGLRRSVLRKAVETLRPGLRDLDFEVIERAVQFLSHPTRSGNLELSLGLSLSLEQPFIYLANNSHALPMLPEWPQLSHPQLLEIPGHVDLGRAWVIEASEVNVFSPESSIPDDPWIAVLAADRLSPPIWVDRPNPGQRFQPLGMDGKFQKLSDFFINRHFPRRARQNWPLVLSGDQVAWIPGGGPSHHFSVTPNTRKTVTLRAYRA